MGASWGTPVKVKGWDTDQRSLRLEGSSENVRLLIARVSSVYHLDIKDCTYIPGKMDEQGEIIQPETNALTLILGDPK